MLRVLCVDSGACYRGDRLYDTPATRAMVTKWMAFWSKYRAILTQDIIHVKRPDMQSVDVLLHVSANASEAVCGLAMLYNPTLSELSVTQLALPLYYSGEHEAVLLSQEEGESRTVAVHRDYSIVVNATVPPNGVTYFVIKRKKR